MFELLNVRSYVNTRHDDLIAEAKRESIARKFLRNKSKLHRADR